MEQNRFFRAIWRFNALLLAFGGVLVVAVVAWNALSWPRFDQTPEGHFAPVSKDAEKDSTYRLQRTTVAFSEEAIFSLHRWNGSPQSYGLADVMVRASVSSYVSALDGVDLLAVMSTTGAGHWLFRGHRRAVLSEQGMTRDASANGDAAPSATALVIQTIDADTNKDGALTEKDKQSLYFYRPGMQSAEKFLDADYIISREQTGADGFLIVYERGKSAVAATYSVPDFKLKSEKPVPSVPN